MLLTTWGICAELEDGLRIRDRTFCVGLFGPPRRVQELNLVRGLHFKIVLVKNDTFLHLSMVCKCNYYTLFELCKWITLGLMNLSARGGFERRGEINL